MEGFYQSATGRWRHVEEGMGSCAHLPVVVRWGILCEMKLVWHRQGLQMEAAVHASRVSQRRVPLPDISDGFISDKEFSSCGSSLDLWSDEDARISQAKPRHPENSHDSVHCPRSMVQAKQGDTSGECAPPLSPQSASMASNQLARSPRDWLHLRHKHKRQWRGIAHTALSNVGDTDELGTAAREPPIREHRTADSSFRNGSLFEGCNLEDEPRLAGPDVPWPSGKDRAAEGT